MSRGQGVPKRRNATVPCLGRRVLQRIRRGGRVRNRSSQGLRRRRLTRQKAGQHHCNPHPFRSKRKPGRASSESQHSTSAKQSRLEQATPGEYSHNVPGREMLTHTPAETLNWSDESPDFVLPELDPRPKPLLLGLPCSRCRVYYEAELTACPICGCSERVSPTEASPRIRVRSRAA
jgi:hypothetical protein